MKKHGFSHAAAVLVCSVSSALLVDVARKHIPPLYDWVIRFSRYITDLVDTPISPQHFSIMIYASILAAVWGGAFALVHED